MSITLKARKRLSSDESRAAALEAARDLLLEAGPQAVTLKAVAARVGRTHANLLHHFGSAAELQSALAGYMGAEVTRQVAATVELQRSGKAEPRQIVDETFDAFGEGGAGALAAWMILSGNRDALDPILDSIRCLVEQLTVGHEEHHVAESTLWLVLAALGDSLLGQEIAAALGLPRDSARSIASQSLQAEIQSRHPHG
jgi:AcrR family transcriptional regulator